MLTRVACSLFLISQLLFASAPADAQGQNPNKRANQRAHGGQGLFNLEDTKGFPGTGDINAWESSKPLYRGGLRCLRNGQWNEAIEKFRAALALYPYEYKSYIGIGKATEEMGGNILDAENSYRQALKLKSDSWQAWELLANVLYMEKKYDEARQALANADQLPVPAANRDELKKLLFDIESAQRNKEHPPEQNSL